jgi:outer membrane immunogenic protein
LKIFIAAAAALLVAMGGESSLAADMSIKAPQVEPVAAWSWTGFYGGINGGYGVATDPFAQSFVGNISNPFVLGEASSVNSTNAPKGEFLGLQGGYNYQIGQIVWGVEGDWQWANQRAKSCGFICSFGQTPDVAGIFIFGASGGTEFSVDQKIDWFATARGRIGWTPSNGTMLYATAGGAWMGIDETDVIRNGNTGGSVVPGVITSTTTASFSNTKIGYAVGAGAEVRLWGNWTGKVEYLHIDVGGTANTAVHSAGLIGPLALTTTTGDIKNDIVRLGVNYKFGQWGTMEASAPSISLPVKTPLDRAPLIWNWSGFYLGASGGYGVASDEFSQTVTHSVPVSAHTTVNLTNTPKGEFLGLQGGYNYQTGQIVWGVEGDWQWANQSANTCGASCVSTTPTPPGIPSTSFNSVDQKINWFATARGRIGWTPSNGTMLYATAGGAWMGIDETDANFSSISATTITSSFSNTKSGYALGAGAEFRLWDNWTGKVEYLHIDVGGTTNTGGPSTFVLTTATSSIKDDIVRLGVNYKLGDLASVLTR